ncbi:TPA: hypothetical protein G8R56_002687 [Salmonella enterica]|uniref:Uncharacterized protein n=1 Tax=Salmonella enterica TaxID=28901 RepID=A0A759M7R3_SALER|nr:hypothetical protein [Salmonella enterica]HAG1964474.1 hypothetical protein [Salmonella enterica]
MTFNRKGYSRGQLSPDIARKSRELLGYVISQQELRLMPYVHHCAMNDGYINQQRVSAPEREILRQWETRGFGRFGPHLSIEKFFWSAINEILWLGYVMPVCGALPYTEESSQ